MIMSEHRIDILTELVTLGIGKAAEVLNIMLNSHIELSVPEVRILEANELPQSLGKDQRRLSAVSMHYNGSMDGVTELIFESAEAGKLVDCLTGEEHALQEGLDAMRAGALCEVGNVVINALMGAISNELDFHLTYTVPSYLEGNIDTLVAEAKLAEAKAVLLAKTFFSVSSLKIEGEIAVFMSLASLNFLEQSLDRYTTS
jgi:chemotaxis protein CheC